MKEKRTDGSHEVEPTRPEHLEVRVANRPLQKMIGLLAKDAMDGADAILITSCSSIHTFGMQKSIDVAFINKDGRVLRSLINLPANRLATCRGAKAVLERFSNSSCYWLKQGDQLKLEPLTRVSSHEQTQIGADDEGVPALPECEF